MIGRRSIGGSPIAFAGVIVIVLGQARADLGQEALIGSLAILGSALCYAVNIVMMRHQSLAAKPLEINFFQSLTVLVLWLAAVPVVGVPHWPDEWWTWILCRGVHVDRRRPAVFLGLCAGRGELSRRHRI